MTLDTLIMLAGVFVIIEPRLGFPTSWDTAILLVLGILIVALGIALRRRGKHAIPEAQKTTNDHLGVQ